MIGDDGHGGVCRRMVRLRAWHVGPSGLRDSAIGARAMSHYSGLGLRVQREREWPRDGLCDCVSHNVFIL